jgi:predicted RNase H-like nuclease (RuvC/YqgF family)
MATRRRETYNDQTDIITRSTSQRGTTSRNTGAQEEDKEQEIARLRTREQRLKRKIRVLQSVNDETKAELEELREVVETLVETGAYSLISSCIQS